MLTPSSSGLRNTKPIPASTLRKVIISSPRNLTKANQFQILKSTDPAPETSTPEQKSPAETNRERYGYQPQQMDIITRLIITQVNDKREPCLPEAMERIRNLDIAKMKSEMKRIKKQNFAKKKENTSDGVEILEQCGLEEVKVHPNGNCQYYSVAMALLN